MVLGLLLCLLLLPGCLTAVDPDTRGDAGVAGGLDAAPRDGIVVADPPIFDCGKADGGDPTQLVSLEYQVRVGSCSASTCMDFYNVADCNFRLQVNNVEATAVLSRDHCDALGRWATSAGLHAALQSGTACGDGKGDEETSIAVRSGEKLGRKFSGCADPTLEHHRTCMRALKAIYFPAPR